MLLLASAPAHACPCGMTPREDAERADDVFRGKLVALRSAWPAAIPEPIWDRLPVTWRPEYTCRAVLEVTEVIKGDRSATRSVSYEAPYGECGSGASIGDEHLVFAVRRDGESWFLRTCGSSGRVAERAPILAALGPGVAPDPPAGKDHFYAMLAGGVVLLGLVLSSTIFWWRRVTSA